MIINIRLKKHDRQEYTTEKRSQQRDPAYTGSEQARDKEQDNRADEKREAIGQSDEHCQHDIDKTSTTEQTYAEYAQPREWSTRKEMGKARCHFH